MNSITVRSLSRTLALGATLLLVPLSSLWHSADAQTRRRSTTIYRNGRTVTRTYRRSPYSNYLRPYRNPALTRRNRSTYNYGYTRPYNYRSNGTGRYTTRRRYYTAPNGRTYYRTERVYR